MANANTNTNTKNNRKESKRMEYAKDGVLNSQFTQKGYFVKVRPAFGIHRIKFSFVEKGKKGTGFDLYVDIDVFDNWADDIISFRFMKVLEMEKQQGVKYPDAFKYVTGENGEKSVGFCNSSNKGYVVHGETVINGEKKYANIPVDYNWLRTTAKYYKRCIEATGLFDNLVKLTVESSSKRVDELSEADVESTQEVQGNNVEANKQTTPHNNPAPAQAPASQTAPEQATPTPAEKPKKETPKKEIIALDGSVEIFTTDSLVKESDGNRYYCKGEYFADENKQDKAECFVVFDEGFIEAIGQSRFNNLVEIAKDNKVRLVIGGSYSVSKSGKKTFYAQSVAA